MPSQLNQPDAPPAAALVTDDLNSLSQRMSDMRSLLSKLANALHGAVPENAAAKVSSVPTSIADHIRDLHRLMSEIEEAAQRAASRIL